MDNEIISYDEMCQREGAKLQRGMNFRLGGTYSIFLMSTRKNSPYRDRIEEDGKVLIYEGHDQAKTDPFMVPKRLDQPEKFPSGRWTENGKFHAAAQAYKNGNEEAESIRVYEKIKPGIWSYNGTFRLENSWMENDGKRNVFKFRLRLMEELSGVSKKGDPISNEQTRMIPSHVKLEVWQRDKGKCVQCGATDELHFDHVIPFSMGGSSLVTDNIQLLCARHNLQKSDSL